MFLEERQDSIMGQLRLDGKVTVRALSKQFGVTEDCIRKDLGALEKKGILKRTYGGAVPMRSELSSRDVIKRRMNNVVDKRRIAYMAEGLINEDDMVFMGISDCNIALAEQLIKSEKRFTVVTDMLDVLVILARNPFIRVIAVGGEFNLGRDGFVSAESVAQIKEMRPDIAFIGATGIDASSGNIYTDEPEEKLQKQTIIASSKATYLLLETKRLEAAGKFKYASLSNITGIITNESPGKELVAKLAKKKVKLVVPKERPQFSRAAERDAKEEE